MCEGSRVFVWQRNQRSDAIKPRGTNRGGCVERFTKPLRGRYVGRVRGHAESCPWRYYFNRSHRGGFQTRPYDNDANVETRPYDNIVVVHQRQTPPVRHGLPEIIRGFKTFSARRINEHRGTPGIPVWQRNYYEHIVRNDESLNRVRQYISDNPLAWIRDCKNPSPTEIET
jgi:hypothetical protein